MNQDKPSEQPALTAPAPAGRPAGGGDRLLRRLIALLALLGLAVLALGGLSWQSEQRFQATREELSRRVADGVEAQREAEVRARQNREALDALQGKVGALEAKLAETQGQQLALETMYQELSRVRDDRLLAEIEQEVAIAAQQLQLAGNVEAALIALQGAEARLARSAQPQFLGLRKLIVRDIERLKSLPAADVSGIALKLDVLLGAVQHLPLAFEQRPASLPAQPAGQQTGPEAAAPVPAFAEALRAWLMDLWGELRQLVRIERIDRPDPGLLAPRETFFLRENLRLRLLSARLALLARDGRGFQTDLKQAGEWLENYFDLRAPAVVEMQGTLKQLGGLDVTRAPAELNETLAALRNFKLSRDRSDRGPAK